jgi:Rod binding domain-containing protein
MDSGFSAVADTASMALANGTKAPTVRKGLDMKAAKKVAQDFETFFASQVLEQMFSNIKTDGLFGGGHGEEMFRSLLLDSYAKKIGQTGGFGIGDQVMKSLLQHQEVAS